MKLVRSSRFFFFFFFQEKARPFSSKPSLQHTLHILDTYNADISPPRWRRHPQSKGSVGLVQTKSLAKASRTSKKPLGTKPRCEMAIVVCMRKKTRASKCTNAPMPTLMPTTLLPEVPLRAEPSNGSGALHIPNHALEGILLYPKFHCGLNYIERSRTKSYHGKQ